MKATLEFTLPDDQYEFAMATNASRYLSALQDMGSKLRNKVKYAPDDAQNPTWEEVREMFFDCVNSNGADLDVPD